MRLKNTSRDCSYIIKLIHASKQTQTVQLMPRASLELCGELEGYKPTKVPGDVKVQELRKTSEQRRKEKCKGPEKKAETNDKLLADTSKKGDSK